MPRGGDSDSDDGGGGDINRINIHQLNPRVIDMQPSSMSAIINTSDCVTTSIKQPR